jgi:hypothetical protein
MPRVLHPEKRKCPSPPHGRWDVIRVHAHTFLRDSDIVKRVIKPRRRVLKTATPKAHTDDMCRDALIVQCHPPAKAGLLEISIKNGYKIRSPHSFGGSVITSPAPP